MLSLYEMGYSSLNYTFNVQCYYIYAVTIRKTDHLVNDKQLF